MAEEGKRSKHKAHLLLTFDLDSQELIASEGVVGDLKEGFQPVRVDWLRLLTAVQDGQKRKPVPDPPDPPWGRPVVDEDHEHRRTPPWQALGDDESTEPEETPPKV